MPRLRRLSGPEIIKILSQFGFEVSRVKGSHHRMTRISDDGEQHITVAVHRRKSISLGTLKRIYREACLYIPEDELRPHFYTD